MDVDLDLGDTQLILRQCRAHGVLRNQVAYVLATACWETARTMRPVEEAFYLEGDVQDLDAWRRRNLRYYPWYGRGYAQLTWETNYRKATDATGVDLISSPEAAMQPEVAAQILVVGMMEGWFTGKKLDDYVTLRKSDFINARRVVNGTDEASAIAKIARDYDAKLRSIGYDMETHQEIDMDDRKSKFQSKTIWGGVIAALGGGGGLAPILAVVFNVMGYDVSSDAAAEILQGLESLIATAAGLFAVFGRIVATKEVR